MTDAARLRYRLEPVADPWTPRGGASADAMASADGCRSLDDAHAAMPRAERAGDSSAAGIAADAGAPASARMHPATLRFFDEALERRFLEQRRQSLSTSN